MKIKKVFFFGLTVTCAFTACNQVDLDDTLVDQQNQVLNTLTAFMPDYTPADETRLYVDNDMKLNWDTGDQFGIHYSTTAGSGGCWFTLTDGNGTAVGNFTSNGFLLNSNDTYYGLYPFNKNATVNSTVLDYSQQDQLNNHYIPTSANYLCGRVYTDANGKGIIQFKPLGALLTLRLMGLSAGTSFTKMTITSNMPFYPKQILRMALGESGRLLPSTSSGTDTITLTFNEGNGFSIAGAILGANIMLPPANMTSYTKDGTDVQNEFTIRLYEDNGREYVGTITGINLQAGNIYGKSVTMKPDGLITDFLAGHAYVDLGVKNASGQTVYWATTNVGAENPWDEGNYYAWGEVRAYDEEMNSYPSGYTTKNINYESGYVKTIYSTQFYKWYVTYDNVYTKYTTNGLAKLESSDDAAIANWGSGWRMATSDEWSSLKSSCFRVKVDNYKGTGIKGMIVYKAINETDKGKLGYEGNTLYSPTKTPHIFLPYVDSKTYKTTSSGGYWTSELNKNTNFSEYAIFYDNDLDISSHYRENGRNIRAVYVK